MAFSEIATGGLTLFHGSKTFYVKVSEEHRRFEVTIGGTMGSGPGDTTLIISDRFDSSIGQDFEIQVNCETDRMEIFFKGEHLQTVYSTHSGNVIPVIDKIDVGGSSYSSSVFLRYKDG